MTASLESVLGSLSAMERFFRGGKRWGKGMYHNNENRTKCLVGAVTSVRASSGNSSWVPTDAIAAARHYIEQAIVERGGRRWGDAWVIQTFNDSQPSYHEIAAVIARAKQMATADLRPAPSPLPETLGPWSRPALTYQPGERVEIITMADLERVAVKRR
jgi:hypothetical protein